MAALRAPVLLVRLRPAPRPGCSGRAPRAGCRRCARHEVAGLRRGAQVLISSQRISLARRPPSAWGRTAVPTRCADDAGECSARRHRFGTKSSVAEAILRSPGHNDATRHPRRVAGALSRPCPWPPVHGSRSTVPTCHGGGQLASQLGWPAGLRGVRYPSLGCGWLLSR